MQKSTGPLQAVFQCTDLMQEILTKLPTQSALWLVKSAARAPADDQVSASFARHLDFYENKLRALNATMEWPVQLGPRELFDEHVAFELIQADKTMVDHCEVALRLIAIERDANEAAHEAAQSIVQTRMLIDIRDSIDRATAGGVVFAEAAAESHSESTNYIKQLIQNQESGLICIQAPPGAGKSFFATEIIKYGKACDTPVEYRTFNNALADEMVGRIDDEPAKKRIKTSHGAELQVYTQHYAKHKKLVNMSDMKKFFESLQMKGEVIEEACEIISKSDMEAGDSQAQDLVRATYNPATDYPFTHGCYGLHNRENFDPTLGLTDDYKVYLFDEAQDGKQEMVLQLRRALAGHNHLVILLGDTLQRIWKEDSNLFEHPEVEDPVQFSLKCSFRFGHEVALLHNICASWINGCHVPIRGLGPPVEVKRMSEWPELLKFQRIVIICHSNSNLLWIGAKLLDLDAERGFARRRVFVSQSFQEGLLELQSGSISLQWAVNASKNEFTPKEAETVGSVELVNDWDGSNTDRTLTLVTAHSVKGAEYKDSAVYTHGDIKHASDEVKLVAFTRAGRGSVQILNKKLGEQFGIKKFL